MPFLRLLDTAFTSERFVPKDGQTSWSATSFRSRFASTVDNQPLRPKADSPPCRPPSPDRHVDFALRLDAADTIYLSSGAQSPIRGRPLQRVPATNRSLYRSPSSWAATRYGDQPIATGLNLGQLRDRLLSRDLTETPAEHYYDDSLLEPWPLERYKTRSLSAELHRAATYDSSIDVDTFRGHRDTFALMGFRRQHDGVVDLPHASWQTLALYLDLETHKALRLSCRMWEQAVTGAQPVTTPSDKLFPPEILEKIYLCLTPFDFNAARHTCRAWMIASLSERLLTAVLREGGWWGAAQQDMAKYSQMEGRNLSAVRQAWLMSKRLATECSLSPDHTQLSAPEVHTPSLSLVSRCKGIVLTSETDFSELAREGKAVSRDPALCFTVSVCQRYLVVTRNTLIYIYSISPPEQDDAHQYGGYLQHASTIDCNERVLSVGMDTSAGRYGVAALLANRKGIVCDDFPTNYFNEPYIYHESHRTRRDFQSIDSLHYPPLSVAICPHRRCVGYGNDVGVDLRWVDVLSGQDLQRWLPLSTPSDTLYFLPNRDGIDNHGKLRLIASVAHPVQRQAIDSIYPDRATTLAKVPIWDDGSGKPDPWMTSKKPSRVSSDVSSLKGPDHYGAKPLSDGYSILFVDEKTERLCLGGDDRPVFSARKLTRRFIFCGPSEGLIPCFYTAGVELSWGVRIVAGYVRENDPASPAEVWLFSVPPDLFKGGKMKKMTEMTDMTDTEDDNDKDPIEIIYGAYIATVAKLVDLSVGATDGDLTIRAFSAEAKAYTWQLAGSARQDVVKRIVSEDGETIAYVNENADVDVDMPDAREYEDEDSDSINASPRTHVHLQTSSSPRECSMDEDGDVKLKDAQKLSATANEDEGARSAKEPLSPNRSSRHESGSLDYPTHGDSGYGSGYEGEGHHSEYEQSGGAFAIHAPPLHGRWSEDDHEWVPEYLKQHMTGLESEGLGLDIIGSMRLELEFVGHYRQFE